MEHVFDFIHAALPWVAIGLLLAVFAARSAKQKKASKDNKPQADYGTEGMCLGMCFGSAIGASGVVNIGIGMSLGMLIGLAIGTCIKKEDREDSSKE
ncbi:MAG: hypothetical protein PUC06_01825 [Oscillospiraceae bacterium]|nr:hypothetical protein [Oscillospiraceae bacterium]